MLQVTEYYTRKVSRDKASFTACFEPCHDGPGYTEPDPGRLPFQTMFEALGATAKEHLGQVTAALQQRREEGGVEAPRRKSSTLPGVAAAIGKNAKDKKPQEYVDNLRKRMALVVRHVAQAQLLTAQEAYLKNNAGRKPQGWKVGDFAMLHSHAG